MVDTHCKEKASQFDHTNSRALVTLGTVAGREDCIEADPERTMTLFYRNQKCRNGRIGYEENSVHDPPTWQPKCIVVLIEQESRAALRDSLMEQGRILVQPLKVSLNYTVAQSEDPDLEVASTNCVLGLQLKNLYEQDRAGQEQRDRLVTLQAELVTARAQFELFNNVYLGLSAFRPPTSPPPPSTPPVGAYGPPAPPAQVSLGERLEQLRENVDVIEVSIVEAEKAIEVCVPSATTTCGRPSLLAPNPWIANGGKACAGNGTYEAIEGLYCGYWGSNVNPLAASQAGEGEAEGLLSEDAAPYCFSSTGTALKCPVTADRTIRSGVQELKEWARLDRSYCESHLFRELILDNTSATEAECRTAINERIIGCTHGICPQCISQCTYPVAKTISSVVKCADTKRHVGFLYFYMVTDAGQLAQSMHGAVRKDNFAAVPSKLGSHLYHIGHNNPQGLVQRDSVSCRKQHRRSQVAHFAPGFDEEGSPIARSGYMQACSKHSDCLVCGRHPLTSAHYRCQHRYILYDTVATTEKGGITFVNTTGGSANVFDPDMEEGGITGMTGICVDIDSSYNEGCTDEEIANVKDSMMGCFDEGIGGLLCGLSLEIQHGDISTVQTSGDLFYPRVLLTGAEDHDGDGQADPTMTCSDRYDCVQKCKLLSRTARHGAGAPPTCALCNQMCPNDILTSVMDIRDAVYEDTFTILRLIHKCLGNSGLAGCMCQFISTLEPEWRKVSTSEAVRCENGDPFELIVAQLGTEIIDWGQWSINTLIGTLNTFLTTAFCWAGVCSPGPIDPVCFGDPRRPKKCDGFPDAQEAAAAHFSECQNPAVKGGLDMTCYYHRVRAPTLYTALSAHSPCTFLTMSAHALRCTPFVATTTPSVTTTNSLTRDTRTWTSCRRSSERLLASRLP